MYHISSNNSDTAPIATNNGDSLPSVNPILNSEQWVNNTNTNLNLNPKC